VELLVHRFHQVRAVILSLTPDSTQSKPATREVAGSCVWVGVSSL
jgi:hypothetical protein